MLMDWPGFAPFLPFVIFSAACMATWLIDPVRSQHLVIRVGIFTGVIVSLQFLLLIMAMTSAITLFAALFAGPGLAMVVFALSWVATRIRRFTIRALMIFTTAIAVLIALLHATVTSWTEFFASVLALSLPVLAATPTLCLISYCRASYFVAVRSDLRADWRERPLVAGASVVAWMVLWMTSWKYALDIMFDKYSKLPTTDPNCYVSAAAASGHRWLVGTDESGVNSQMRRLKFLEFACAAVSPHCHRSIRRCYNRWGPLLATICKSNRYFSDVTYLLLKPLELFSTILAWAASVPASRLSEIYSVRTECQLGETPPLIFDHEEHESA